MGREGEIVSGRYRIDKLLGEGGMGAVYLAEHTLMRKRVALKLLRPEMVQNPEAVARFEREAVAAAKIDHPNVVAATDFGKTDDGAFFLALEYVEGTSLRDVLTGPIAIWRTIHIARQIALALDRAHEAGIVHRDLKPENVMLVSRADDPDFVKVLDFGIAKLPIESRETTTSPGPAQVVLTKMGEILGTPEYMSPEQSMGDPVGPASDQYALGIVMYEMLTGLHPFNPPTREMLLTMHVLEPVPPMKKRAPDVDVPEQVEAIVQRLVAKMPADRYPRALDVVKALDAAIIALRAAEVDDNDIAQRKTELELPEASDPKIEAASVPVEEAPISTRALKAANDLAAVTAPKVEAFAREVRARSSEIYDNKVAPTLDDVARRTNLPRGIVAIVGGAALLLVLGVVMSIVVSVAKSDNSADSSAAQASASASASIVSTQVMITPPPPPKPVRATPEQIAGAVRNPEALEELAQEFPQDPIVMRELALAYHDNGRTEDAMRAMGSTFALDPYKSDRDKELLAIIGRTVTYGKGKVVDDALALLEGPCGADGVDVLIELSRNNRAPILAKRAQTSLEKAEVREHATKAAAIILDLRAAQSCQDKHDLLERAAEDGDTRLITALRSLKGKRGCGFLDLEDCWPCLRNDRDLDDAIDAITARTRQRP